eukprot:SM000281S10756  [mRNA]  locus=s281:93124:95370:- [translate_table: standard]
MVVGFVKSDKDFSAKGVLFAGCPPSHSSAESCLTLTGGDRDAGVGAYSEPILVGHPGGWSHFRSRPARLTGRPRGWCAARVWPRTSAAAGLLALRADLAQCLGGGCSAGILSGTTATVAVLDGWSVTVGSVGDSRCVLDMRGGSVMDLSVDHRLEVNAEEVERVKASGGELGRLMTQGGHMVGPLRCWPGGLCLSRSIGDIDVGEFIVPIPFVKQVKLPPSGGRLIIATDGLWDAISSEKAAKDSRGLSHDSAAKSLVKTAIKSRGLRDDITCIVVDMLPNQVNESPPPVQKSKLAKSLSLLRKTKSNMTTITENGILEEVYEQGSAHLAERLGPDDSSVHAGQGIFLCAICRADLSPLGGISVHAGSAFAQGVGNAKAWEGPFLCTSCKSKMEAMEGRQPGPPQPAGASQAVNEAPLDAETPFQAPPAEK